MIHNVQIHKTESKRLSDVHIAAAWESSSKEYWYILSTEPTTIQTFWEYGLRFDIEENFLDDKSNGFDLESSRLRSAPAISRLCFVIAMTTLFLTAQGLAVADSDVSLTLIGFVGLVISRLAGTGFTLLLLKTGLSRLLSVNQRPLDDR